MSLDSPEPEAPVDQKSEERAAEAAAIRRRWITLGEVLAVVAVIISALTLWNNWSERSDSKAAESASAERASARAGTLVLVAADSGERVLVLKPSSADQTVQSQKIAFPLAAGHRRGRDHRRAADRREMVRRGAEKGAQRGKTA